MLSIFLTKKILFYSDWDLYKLIFNNHYPVIATGKFIFFDQKERVIISLYEAQYDINKGKQNNMGMN